MCFLIHGIVRMILAKVKSINPSKLFLISFHLLFLLFWVQGCTNNPATGKKSISLNTMAEEEKIGRSEHPKILRTFGGEYNNLRLKNYIRTIGNKLANVSELPNINWKFTILNSKEVNAFAVPGGYIYVTRGLIALANNEAELAAVLAHEIGHITALHPSSRRATGTLTGIGVLASGIIFGRAGSEISDLIGRYSMARYSKSQEFEADLLGVRYLSRANYEPKAMASFLRTMNSFSKYTKKIAGEMGGESEMARIFASHPRTAARVERAIKIASEPKAVRQTNRITYLKMIDGLLYGDTPKVGIIQNQTFIHPSYQFKITFPMGFKVINRSDSVMARHADNSQIQLRLEKKLKNKSMTRYLSQTWGRHHQLLNHERIVVNNMAGATATSVVVKNGRAFDIRFVAINGTKVLIQLVFTSPRNYAGKHATSFKETAYSFSQLSVKQANIISGQRIRVTTVKKGDTLSKLAQKMEVKNYKEECLMALNGLTKFNKVRTGQLIKLISR